MSNLEPCNTCGSSVRVVLTRIDGVQTNKRKCLNRECPTNTGEKSVADYV